MKKATDQARSCFGCGCPDRHEPSRQWV